MWLTVRLGQSEDLEWAQETVAQRHYLRKKADPRSRPMVYVVNCGHQRLGLCIVGTPHATRNREWWGYSGLPTQWQVVDLSRIWLDQRVQRNGELARPDIVPGFVDRRGVFRPTVATWLIHRVLDRVQRDRISLWPPVYLAQPYHIRLAISYHDPALHKGTIYQEAGAEPMYSEKIETPSGDVFLKPKPGPSGKYGWCWRLPEPNWTWQDIEIARPRTLRFEFS